MQGLGVGAFGLGIGHRTGMQEHIVFRANPPTEVGTQSSFLGASQKLLDVCE